MRYFPSNDDYKPQLIQTSRLEPYSCMTQSIQIGTRYLFSMFNSLTSRKNHCSRCLSKLIS